MKDYSVIDGICRDNTDKAKLCFDKGYKQGYADGKKEYEERQKCKTCKYYGHALDEKVGTDVCYGCKNHKLYKAKQDDEIRVGDEIENDIRGKAIVLYKEPYGLWHCIYSLGAFSLLKEHQSLWHKTGRHFDQIEEVLKQMQE